MKKLLGIVVGYLVWTAIFLGGGAVLRSAFGTPEAGAGAADLPVVLLVLLLVLSFSASFVAGALTARMAGGGRPALILGGLLLGTGIPVQLGAWDQLPVWYHLVFLGMLVPMTVAGGRRGAPAPR